MNPELKSQILGLIRHILTTAGGGLAAQGLASADEINTAAGAIVTLVGVIWSILEKRARRQRAGAPAASPSP
ncbi:MAG: hypothetical protein D6781_10645 [Verrucomicrobia bacterium]|nr:MAG: hypothetical protein D6781_10645 [Verrucomicrobiota bacterium]